MSSEDQDIFGDRLSALVSKEAAQARGDANRMGAMVERLARALGFTVAIACRGNAAAIDEMMTGAEGYAHAEAVDKARLVVMMNLHARQALSDHPDKEGGK